MNTIRLAWLAGGLCLFGLAGCPNESTEDPDGTTTEKPPDDKPKINPEAVCEKYGVESCNALAGCCADGTELDPELCQHALSETCLNALDPELVRAGAFEYDEEAAKACFAPLAGCSPLPSPSAEQVSACATMVSGHRPPGAPCSSARECEQAEAPAVATCYSGYEPGTLRFCATQVVSDNGTCGFSFDDYVVRICPEGTYCDMFEKTFPPDAPPSALYIVFEAPCAPYRLAGEPCVAPGTGAPLVCGEGLYCDTFGDPPADPVCVPVKAEGAECEDSIECAEGLYCQYPGDGPPTCQSAGVPYCYTPPACGDAICQVTESEVTCPEDCGFCGDGHCSIAHHEDYWCADDCGTPHCGDGECVPLELMYGNCPEDCGQSFCSDGSCDPGEDPMTCPEDCAFCGDGYCLDGEDPEVCPADCEPGTCGNNVCDPGEDESTCPQDCACFTCAEYISSNELDLCPGPSTDYYNALVDCSCLGPCASECGDNLCTGGNPASYCINCVLNVSTGCGQQYNECANDI